MRSAVIAIACLSLVCPFGQVEASVSESIRELLFRHGQRSSETKALGTLFERADSSGAELIRLLDDPDERVSLAAQRVIRYSGNPDAVAGLYAWHERQRSELGTVSLTGPIVVPLRDSDYEWYEGRARRKDSAYGAEFVYALALDNSPRAREMLHRIVNECWFDDENTYAYRAIQLVASGTTMQTCPRDRDLVKWIPRNAFFLDDEDRKVTTARILGFNESRTKVLAVVYVNRGVLAEEWYNVVLAKSAGGWTFVAIHRTAIS